MSKEEKMVYPKLKLQHNHILITANKLYSDSKIILEGQSANNSMKVNQTVVAKGVNVPEIIEVGSLVYLDVDKIRAKAQSSGKQIHLRAVAYSNKTGEVLHDDNAKDFDEEEIEDALLITYNEILAVL